MSKFMVIGERIHCISPAIRQAFADRNPEPILLRAKEQLDAGADYLDLNIGPAEKGGEELMQWGVKILQENFDNVPIALDTANMKAIEAGIKVYNRSKGKPIVNSADAGDRIGYLDLAAANDAMCIAVFMTLLNVLQGEHFSLMHTLENFVYEIVVAAMIGWAFGLGILRLLRGKHEMESQILTTALLACGSYLVALFAHASAPIACVIPPASPAMT